MSDDPAGILICLQSKGCIADISSLLNRMYLSGVAAVKAAAPEGNTAEQAQSK